MVNSHIRFLTPSPDLIEIQLSDGAYPEGCSPYWALFDSGDLDLLDESPLLKGRERLEIALDWDTVTKSFIVRVLTDGVNFNRHGPAAAKFSRAGVLREEAYYDRHGALHKYNAPALITYYPDGRIRKAEYFYHHGTPWGDGFPAIVYYDWNEHVTDRRYYIDGLMLSREKYDHYKEFGELKKSICSDGGGLPFLESTMKECAKETEDTVEVLANGHKVHISRRSAVAIGLA